ncbi:MAG: hypothetical protein M3N68_03905 [Actinomycetota bacterium]|nr:hypothetical protein [Actinomycetota bacterium]
MSAADDRRVAEMLYRRQIVVAAVVAAVVLAVLLLAVVVITEAEGTAFHSPLSEAPTPTGERISVPVEDQVGLGWTAVAALVAMGAVLVLALGHLVLVMRFVFGTRGR